jgi:transposase-like protein
MTTPDPYSPPRAALDAAPSVAGVAKCPNCGHQSASKVGFTWWGGAVAPRVFHVVKCHQCARQYNGRTGGSLTRVIVIYQLAAVLLGLGGLYLLRGYWRR